MPIDAMHRIVAKRRPLPVMAVFSAIDLRRLSGAKGGVV